MFVESFKVDSPNVNYTENEIHSVYSYETTELVHENRNGTYQWIVKPKTVKYEFKTDTHIPKLGYFSVLIIKKVRLSHCVSRSWFSFVDYFAGLCLLGGVATMARLLLLVSLRIGSKFLILVSKEGFLDMFDIRNLGFLIL